MRLTAGASAAAGHRPGTPKRERRLNSQVPLFAVRVGGRLQARVRRAHSRRLPTYPLLLRLSLHLLRHAQRGAPVCQGSYALGQCVSVIHLPLL
jgi:hypothetical protein